MNLSEFVTATLTQVIEGTKNAQQLTKELGGSVNPKIETAKQHGKVEYTPGLERVTFVSFDVALTAVEESEKSGGIGVVAGSIGLGGRKGSSESETSVSRVQFEVPITLPRG
jgi:hypothetical protein